MMEGWLYNGTPEMRAEQQLNLVLVPIWILMPIMCLVAGLRLWVRRRQLAYEDAILFGAVLCSIAFNVTSIISTRWGVGLSVFQMPFINLTPMLHWNYAGRYPYTIGIGLYKISLCVSYLRLTERTNEKGFRIATFTTIGFLVVFTTSYVLLNVLGCPKNVSDNWHLSAYISGRCLQFGAPNLYQYITVIISDLVVFLLPIKIIRFLNIPLRKKISLIGLFGLGILTTIFSTLRVTTIKAMSDEHGGHNAGKLIAYSEMELMVGITLTCLVHLRGLIEPKSNTKASYTSAVSAGAQKSMPSYGGLRRNHNDKSFADIESNIVPEKDEESGVVGHDNSHGRES